MVGVVLLGLHVTGIANLRGHAPPGGLPGWGCSSLIQLDIIMSNCSPVASLCMHGVSLSSFKGRKRKAIKEGGHTGLPGKTLYN